MNLHISIGVRTKEKSVNFAHFSESLNLETIHQLNQEKKLMIRDQDGSLNYISSREIYYMEADKVYSHIHMRDRSLMVRRYLSELEEEVGDTFLRIHKSYLINTSYVKLLREKEIVLANDVVLPVSRRQYSKVQKTLRKMLGE